MTGPDDDQFRVPLAGSARAPGAADRPQQAARGGASSDIRRLASDWGPVVAWMAVIFVLSAQPGLRVSDDPSVDLPIRHFAHVIVYGVLALLLVRALGGGARDTWTRRPIVLAVALATLYGVTDEIHQTYVPDRTGHLVDVGWDMLGAGLAILILRFMPWRRLRRPSVGMRPD